MSIIINVLFLLFFSEITIIIKIIIENELNIIIAINISIIVIVTIIMVVINMFIATSNTDTIWIG